MARRRGRGFARIRAGRPLRAREWGAEDLDTILTLSSPGNLSAGWLLPPSSVQLLHEPTLIRMLIVASFSMSLSANGRMQAALGVIKMSGMDSTTDAIPTDLPEPIGDEDADWAYLGVRVGTTPVSANLYANIGGGDPADIRSQRKLSNGDGLLAIQMNGPLSSSALNLQWHIRFLVKQ